MHAATNENGSARLVQYEMFQGRDLIYRARFGSFQSFSGYSLPRMVLLEKPDKHISLVIEYEEVDVNVPLDERTFTIREGENAP